MLSIRKRYDQIINSLTELYMFKQISKFVSVASLILLILPSVIFLAGKMELSQVKPYMLIMTFVWFVSAYICMWKDGREKA